MCMPKGGYNKCNKRQFQYKYIEKVWLALFFLYDVARWGLRGSDLYVQHIPQMPD